MNIFAFALITVVAVIIKNELLTHALIIWASVWIARLVVPCFLTDNKPARHGRDY